MAERATEQITIDAPPERCWKVVLDYERYPEWAADIREVEVVERDEEGRGRLVAYRAAAMGRSARYTLEYDYSGAPRVLAWKLVKGDIMRVLDGSYTFEGEGEGDATQATYQLEVELVIPIPGFVKRRAEGKIMGTALRELKRRVEGS